MFSFLKFLIFIYINITFIGMLSNVESMPIERIHSMLRMMSTSAANGNSGSNEEFKFDMNIVQLKRYLQRLVDIDVLDLVSDNTYQLKKTKP